MTDLRCPYCGGLLRIETEYVGRPYLAENTPTGIECWGPPDGYGCGAEWDTSGSLLIPGRGAPTS